MEPTAPHALTAPSDQAVAAVGLTSAEVRERAARGQTNAYELPSSRTYGAIVRANVFTRFNALLGALLVVILVVGPLQDALFGLILVANTAVGIVQEVRAKLTLDRLAVVTAPTARVWRDGDVTTVPAKDVVLDDLVEIAAGDQVVVDATVVSADGLQLDESLLTGESQQVAKHAGDTVMSGSFVTAGTGRCRVAAVGADAYGNRLADQARRFALAPSELRDGINRILRVITWVLVPTAVLLFWSQLTRDGSVADALRGSVAGTVTMVPEGLVLLTSIAFAVGVVRLARHAVLARELPAVEGLARIDVVCLDKTGTLTTGNLTVTDVETIDDTADVASALAALAANDPAPNATMLAIRAASPAPARGWTVREWWAFSSSTKWSGADFGRHGVWLLGAPEMLLPAVRGSPAPAARADTLAASGARVLLLASASTPPGDELPTLTAAALVVAEDELRTDAADTLDYLRREDVGVRVISGDHPKTVAALVSRLGVDAGDPVDARTLPDDPDELAEVVEGATVFGRVRPEQKQDLIAALQSRGHVVGMIGDGVNDVLALRDADVGIAMGAGSSASRAVSQLVLLDSSFTALPRVVGEGRRVIANVERVANLFVTKTVYATLLAISVGVARLPFPFLPRHLSLVSSLTIGIPGFVLALAPNERRAMSGFVLRVLRFTIPAGVVAAAATFVAYRLVRDEPGTDLATARTVATIVLFMVALWVLAILVRMGNRKQGWLVPVMAAGFVVVMAVPAWREFFALTVPRPLLILAAVGVAALSGLALELGLMAAGWLRAAGPLWRRSWRRGNGQGL